MKPKVVVITINYGSSSTTLKFLDSLSRTNVFSKVAVVVDNASGEEELSSLRHAIGQLPNVELLESPTNRSRMSSTLIRTPITLPE